MAVSKATLQVMVLRNPKDSEAAPFEEAIVRAFTGGEGADAYLAGGEDLRVPLRVLEAAPPRPAAKLVTAALHTVIVALVDDALLADTATLQWLAACWEEIKSNESHRLLIVPMYDRAGGTLRKREPALGSNQLEDLHTFGGPSLRQGLLALRVLHLCRQCLAAGIGTPGVDASLRLFISHAKGDGLPLALALGDLIRRYGWLDKFYDASDISSGSDWEAVLQREASSSILVVLRTSLYQTRAWCRQEVRWADESAVPIVVVEARTGLVHAADGLPLTTAPSVTVPDGNLIRVLHLAIRESLRALRFLREVELLRGVLPQQVEVLSRTPGPGAILHACRRLMELEDSRDRAIVYPDPRLPDTDLAVAEAIIATEAAGTALLTPDAIAAGSAIS